MYRITIAARRFRTGLIAVGCAVALTGFMAGVQPAAASTIKVLVNDSPITEYDISQRVKLLNATGNRSGNVQQAAIDELIEEKLKMQEARRLGISASAGAVDNAFNTIASRVNMSPAQFSQALNQMGINPATLKKRLEADIAWSDVVRARFQREVRIRDRDIETALAKKGEEATTAAHEMVLQQVLFIIPSGSSNDFIRQRTRDAEDFRAKYSGCDTAKELARNYRDIVVKDNVRRASTELPPAVAEILKAVPVGKASAPNKTTNAVEMIGVCDRKEIQSNAAARQQIESQMMNEQGERLARRLLIDLRQTAVIERR